MTYDTDQCLTCEEATSLYDKLGHAEYFVIYYNDGQYGEVHNRRDAVNILGYEVKGKSLRVWR